ncbi:MAG: ornithine carbamoyltransferase [Verrucomicrobiota bacterium]
MKHFLSIQSLEGDEIANLVEHAIELKANRGDQSFQPLAGQHWAMIFTKSSTRTRVSFEVGLHELGAHAMFFSGRDLQLGRGEPIRDTARVLGRMVDGAIIRTFDQSDVEAFAEFSGIPTINALTDEEHPCQIIADLQTIAERKSDWRDSRICFLGDGDCNMAISWLWASARLGFELVIGAPPEFQPSQQLLDQLGDARVRIESDPVKAVEGCDVLYTDVWVSMGKEEESASRIETLQPYQLNQQLLEKTGKDPIILHCLPAYREKEITEEVLEAHADTIFEQAENRLHAQKAVLCRAVG